MRSKLRVSTSGSIRLRRFVKDAAVQMLELEVEVGSGVTLDAIKVDLQYSPAGSLVNW